MKAVQTHRQGDSGQHFILHSSTERAFIPLMNKQLQRQMPIFLNICADTASLCTF